MQEQRVIRRRRTNVISLTADEKFNLVTSCGSIKERAETERVHPEPVYRSNWYEIGKYDGECKYSKPGRKRKTSAAIMV